MDAFLVRHAHAGDRRKWKGPDDIRPLSEKGWRQAEGLVAVLSGEGVSRLLSSPSLRCVQTVEPLARRLGLEIEETVALAEGVDARDVVGLAREVSTGPDDGAVVLSTHGDVIPTLLDALARADGLVLPDDYPCAKGSTWRLRSEGGRFVKAEYIPPPG